jgi:chromosomal replication initiator protein
MAEVSHAEKFRELLRDRLVELGMSVTAAANISKKISPVRQKDDLIIAQCNDAFHRNLLVGSMMNEISSVAQTCWGPQINFVFEQGPSISSPKNSTSGTTRRRRTQTLSRQAPSISIFESEGETPLEAGNKIEQPNDASFEFKPTPSKSDPFAKLKETIKHSGTVESAKSPLQVVARHGANSQQGANLQQEFIFENFVRGQSNMIAYSACEAVAQNPGLLSNPVFIYGATGLGKTHLLHAVGNEILASHPSWNVVYVSSQEFMNEMITSIRFNKGAEFRSKYHSADVLLVDDIQFLESKDATQMEFFHVFNVLCEKRKQIVITSDKYPKDIPNIEVRLKSRFLQGLIADIEPPSLEDRIAIIEAKAKMMKLDVSQEIILHIATHVRSNVREIQGLLTNLLMGQSMTGRAPTLETTSNLLRRIVHIQGPTIDIATIQKIVAQHFGLKVSDLTSPKRDKKLVLPRHIAMYLSKEMLGTALAEIAENFHRGDHTTVQHAIKKIDGMMHNDESTRASVRELRRKLERSI